MASSWIDRIGFYDKPETKKTRALLFGDTGVGKTRLAGSFPNPFFFDADRGGKTLEAMKIPYLLLQREGKVYEEIMDVFRAIVDKKPPFDVLPVETIVVDSMTALADMLMTEAMRLGKTALDRTKVKPEWDHYSIIQAKLRSIVTFAQDLNLNFVATCGTKLEKDDIRGTFVGKPNILGGYRDQISFDFDDVIYMACEGSQTTRKYIAYTGKVSYFEGKTRSGLEFKYENPSYASMWGAKLAKPVTQ